MQVNLEAGSGETGGRRWGWNGSSSGNSEVKKRKSPDEWAQIWFRRLCRFHRLSKNSKWQFSLDQVIAFLRSRVEKNDPAWKRLD